MKQKYQLYLLYNSIFLVFLGISLVIPVMPSIMNELDISGSGVGYLTAAFAMTQLIFSPFTGRAADKFGRKIIIVIGMIIFAFSELLFGLGNTIERSEEHTSELQSRFDLVCRLLLEKKKTYKYC